MKQELVKRCARCKKAKPVFDFNKQRKNLDGLQAWCKQCSAENNQQRRDRQKQRDKIFFNPNTPAF